MSASTPAAASEPRKAAGLRGVAALLGLLWVIDLFVLGQGLISTTVAIVGAAVLLPGALWSLAGGKRDAARRRGWRAALFVALGLAAWGGMRFHAWTGATLAEDVIAACREYESDHEELPASLSDLVPEYRTAIPAARISLSHNRFHYSAREGRHVLWYAVIPPAVRRSYSFEEDRWRTPVD